jgi:hypothetical protein
MVMSMVMNPQTLTLQKESADRGGHCRYRWRDHGRSTPLWTPAAAGAWQITALIDPDRRLVEENRADDVASLDALCFIRRSDNYIWLSYLVSRDLGGAVFR